LQDATGVLVGVRAARTPPIRLRLDLLWLLEVLAAAASALREVEDPRPTSEFQDRLIVGSSGVLSRRETAQPLEFAVDSDGRLPLTAVGRYTLVGASSLCRPRRREYAAIQDLEVRSAAVARVSIEESHDPSVADIDDLSMETANAAFLVPEAYMPVMHEELGLPETPEVLIIEGNGGTVAQAKVTNRGHVRSGVPGERDTEQV